MRRAERLLRGLEAIGLDRLLRPWLAGRGAIIVLHRAAGAGVPTIDPDFTINVDLLDNALRVAKREGFTPIAIGDVLPFLKRRRGRERFVAFTFDDGYQDNLVTALPVFRAHNAPLCVYVATGLIDRVAPYWWGALARLVERSQSLDLRDLGLGREYRADTWPQKKAAFQAIEAWVHEDLEGRGALVSRWCAAHGVNERAELDEAMLTWDEVRSISADPLVTVGAHTVSHARLSRLTTDKAREELTNCRARLEAEIGRPVRHLAYPYGGPAACGAREFSLADEAGYETAVTTRAGSIFVEHADRPMALPRQRVTMGEPDPRTARRALTGTQRLLHRRRRAIAE